MTLANMTKHFLHYNWIGPNVWKPYFDGHLGEKLSILPDFPENLIKSGKYNQVPLIIGTNTDEGALNAVGFLDGRASFQDMESHWDMLAPLKLFHRYL